MHGLTSQATAFVRCKGSIKRLEGRLLACQDGLFSTYCDRHFRTLWSFTYFVQNRLLICMSAYTICSRLLKQYSTQHTEILAKTECYITEAQGGYLLKIYDCRIIYHSPTRHCRTKRWSFLQCLKKNIRLQHFHETNVLSSAVCGEKTSTSNIITSPVDHCRVKGISF